MIKSYSEQELKMLFDKENKTTLLDFYFNPLKDFLLKNRYTNLDLEFANDLKIALNKKANVTKVEIINVCSKIYSNQQILVDFSNSLSKRDRLIFDSLIWKQKVSSNELRDLLGFQIYEIYEIENRFGYGRQFSILYNENLNSWRIYFDSNLKDLRYQYDIGNIIRAIKVWMSFPTLKRMIFASALPKPKGFHLEEFILPENVKTFSYEQKIFQELPLLMAYHLQQKIKYSQKGVPSVATVRKMGKELNIECFPLKQGEDLRNMMLTGLITENFRYNSLTETPLTILRQLFSIAIEKRILTPIFLPNLKGINRINDYDFDRNAGEGILRIIKGLPIDTWVSKENLLTHAYSHFCDLEVLSYYNMHSFENVLKESGKYGIGMLRENDIVDEVFHPNLFGYFYLFAAFGLMEIAINKDKDLQVSYYDNFEAFKLTKLGAYVLNLTVKYEMPKLNAGVNLIFEEDSLFIRVEGNVDLAAAIIGSYVVKMSNNRFQFSDEVFLKDCKSTHAIANKVEIFKTAIGKDLPPFWLKHLNVLVANSEAIVQDNFSIIFKLPSENKELIRIIAQDAELKKITIKAEQFHVLVQRKNYAAFISRMKHFGFVINSF